MPRVNRRSKRRSAGLTAWHFQELKTGHSWPFLDPDQAFHGDRDRMQAVWAVLRDKLLADWIQKHPGTRPWAWWEFDAPERRRCLNAVHPFDDPLRNRVIEKHRKKFPDYAPAAKKIYYGCPSDLLGGTDDFDALYESQAEYLKRLDLMNDDEQDRVPEDGWRPYCGYHLRR